jgi:acetyl-CoA C-acetyltransferase
MKTIAFAAQSIALGLNGIVVAGGFESMSNVPHYVNVSPYFLNVDAPRPPVR